MENGSLLRIVNEKSAFFIYNTNVRICMFSSDVPTSVLNLFVVLDNR